MGKHFKKGQSAKFLMLDHWIYDTEAYRSLGLGARALYWALKRKYNGYNNGQVFMSHRDAAKDLARNRGTISVYFKELEEKGFIVKTRGHCLGPNGMGQSTHWALTEYGLNGVKPTYDFKAWQKQKPRWKTQHSMAGKSNHPCRETQHSTVQRLDNPAIQSGSAVVENPAIYRSNHMPKGFVPELSVWSPENYRHNHDCPLLLEASA